MEVGFRASRQLMSRDTGTRLARRAIDRARGQQNTDRLINMGLQVGNGTYIAPNAQLDPSHPWLITIGERVTIGPRVIVLAHDASMQRHLHCTLVARVRIGNRVFLGAGSIILAGSTVGDDAIIGAGAVVRGEIPPGSVVIGNPAQIVSDVESFTAKHREAAQHAPKWPHEGWTLFAGITRKRMAVQREALASGPGYLVLPGFDRSNGANG